MENKHYWKAEKCVDFIIKDIEDRRGIKQEWEKIEPQIKRIIKNDWVRVIAASYVA